MKLKTFKIKIWNLKANVKTLKEVFLKRQKS